PGHSGSVTDTYTHNPNISNKIAKIIGNIFGVDGLKSCLRRPERESLLRKPDSPGLFISCNLEEITSAP
ncbi:hypothetical protein, partial [Bradyrhizobium sp.]|uniref:hypothetical protein n=1 Tax=Bradyrhizobium sp. TaxID=376 RepID=UPI0025BF9798